MKADDAGALAGQQVIDQIVAETIRLHRDAAREAGPAILDAAARMAGCLAAGGKILAFGNGGSAADSQHLAAELVGRFTRERRALAAIALTTDTSILTSLANDYAFDRVFVRQIEALGRAGDVAVGISTSGRSPNVLVALQAARALGMETIALTGGDGGPIGEAADVHVNVPAPTPRAQEVHRTVLHAICELVEREVAKESVETPGRGGNP